MTQPVHSHTIAAYPIKDEHGGGFRGAVLHRASRQVVRSPVMKTLQDAKHWAKSHVHKHFEGDGYKLAPVRRKGEYTANVWVHPKHPNMDKPLEESTRQEFLDLIKPGDVGKSSFLRKMGQSDQPGRGSKDAQKRALHQAINMRPDNPLKTSLAAFATTRSKPGARPQMHEEFRIVLEDVLEEMLGDKIRAKRLDKAIGKTQYKLGKSTSEMNDLTRKRRKIARVPDNSPYDVDGHMHGKLVRAGGKKLDTQAKLSRLLKRHQAIKRRMG